MVEPLSLNFRVFTVKLIGIRKFSNFNFMVSFFCQITIKHFDEFPK